VREHDTERWAGDDCDGQLLNLGTGHEQTRRSAMELRAIGLDDKALGWAQAQKFRLGVKASSLTYDAWQRRGVDDAVSAHSDAGDRIGYVAELHPASVEEGDAGEANRRNVGVVTTTSRTYE